MKRIRKEKWGVVETKSTGDNKFQKEKERSKRFPRRALDGVGERPGAPRPTIETGN